MEDISFKVSYMTYLPREANAPRLTIIGHEPKTYLVKFINNDNNQVLSSGYCQNNGTIVAGVTQVFINWRIEVYDIQKLIFVDFFNPVGKNVFIKIDSYALGDTIAWMPYLQIFKQKYNCNLICSTFHNYLFLDAYPEFLFVQPNTAIENVYAQYYIGAAYDNNPKYCYLNASNVPLQKIASSILNLEHQEVKPKLNPWYYNLLPRFSDKYITLSEFGSAPKKDWQGSWQAVVDFFNDKGYQVLVISKEKTELQNIIDLSGDYPLQERINDILHARYHFGVSSGLSWLAWALNTEVFMISDVTPFSHEFTSNVIRVGNPNLLTVDYNSTERTSTDMVLEKLKNLNL